MASGMLPGASPKSATRVALHRRKAARPDQTTWAWRSTRWPVRTAQRSGLERTPASEAEGRPAATARSRASKERAAA
eukprot:2340392-Alexandrium_andersonii.AAC.1